jgi:hypothetical protein
MGSQMCGSVIDHLFCKHEALTKKKAPQKRSQIAYKYSTPPPSSFCRTDQGRNECYMERRESCLIQGGFGSPAWSMHGLRSMSVSHLKLCTKFCVFIRFLGDPWHPYIEMSKFKQKSGRTQILILWLIRSMILSTWTFHNFGFLILK